MADLTNPRQPAYYVGWIIFKNAIGQNVWPVDLAIRGDLAFVTSHGVHSDFENNFHIYDLSTIDWSQSTRVPQHVATVTAFPYGARAQKVVVDGDWAFVSRLNLGNPLIGSKALVL